MEQTKLFCMMAVLLLLISPFAQAALFDIDLLGLGCPAVFDEPTDDIYVPFDFNTQFIEITSVYMVWSGEIMGTLIYDPVHGDRSTDTILTASLGYNPGKRSVSLRGGGFVYPQAVLFDLVSKINLPSDSTWSDLLDGQGSILLDMSDIVGASGGYDYGSISFDTLNLRIEGTEVPEPTVLAFTVLGAIFFRKQFRNT